jgi:hypothetical protein
MASGALVANIIKNNQLSGRFLNWLFSGIGVKIKRWRENTFKGGLNFMVPISVPKESFLIASFFFSGHPSYFLLNNSSRQFVQRFNFNIMVQ